MSQAGWDRLQYYSRKVRSFTFGDSDHDDTHVHSSTYIRIAQLLQSTSLFPSLRHLKFDMNDMDIIFLFLSPLLESLEFTNIRYNEHTIVEPFLAKLSSQMLRRIVFRNGEMSPNFFKKTVVHFKQLRSLELSDAVSMSDFTLWEIIGALPSLSNLTLKATDSATHPARDPESSNSQSRDLKYFNALESLCVTGSFFFIQHLLGFINSPCLATIKVYPVIKQEHEPDNPFTPTMTIMASKWSQSLKNLVIETDDSSSSSTAQRQQCYAISKCLKLLMVLREMQTFHLIWEMENTSMDDDVILLAKSWPKLRTLKLHLDHPVTFISLSTLRIIAENCPKLRYLQVPLNHDTSTIPFFDTSGKKLHHNLEVLDLLIVDSDRARPCDLGSDRTPVARLCDWRWLECHIRVAKCLDFIFPYLTSIEVGCNETWLGIRDLIKLCQDARQVTSNK